MLSWLPPGIGGAFDQTYAAVAQANAAWWGVIVNAVIVGIALWAPSHQAQVLRRAEDERRKEAQRSARENLYFLALELQQTIRLALQPRKFTERQLTRIERECAGSLRALEAINAADLGDRYFPQELAWLRRIANMVLLGCDWIRDDPAAPMAASPGRPFVIPGMHIKGVIERLKQHVPPLGEDDLIHGIPNLLDPPAAP